jgi:hypothetical protein
VIEESNRNATLTIVSDPLFGTESAAHPIPSCHQGQSLVPLRFIFDWHMDMPPSTVPLPRRLFVENITVLNREIHVSRFTKESIALEFAARYGQFDFLTRSIMFDISRTLSCRRALSSA